MRPSHQVSAGSVAGSDLRPHPPRRFIEVPFEENTEAKWLGARWDRSFKKWYVPRGLDRRLFRWEDVLLPPSMRAVRFAGEKRRKASNKKDVVKNAPPEVKLAISVTQRLDKELDDRLEYLLQKSD